MLEAGSCRNDDVVSALFLLRRISDTVAAQSVLAATLEREPTIADRRVVARPDVRMRNRPELVLAEGCEADGAVMDADPTHARTGVPVSAGAVEVLHGRFVRALGAVDAHHATRHTREVEDPLRHARLQFANVAVLVAHQRRLFRRSASEVERITVPSDVRVTGTEHLVIDEHEVLLLPPGITVELRHLSHRLLGAPDGAAETERPVSHPRRRRPDPKGHLLSLRSLYDAIAFHVLAVHPDPVPAEAILPEAQAEDRAVEATRLDHAPVRDRSERMPRETDDVLLGHARIGVDTLEEGLQRLAVDAHGSLPAPYHPSSLTSAIHGPNVRVSVRYQEHCSAGPSDGRNKSSEF